MVAIIVAVLIAIVIETENSTKRKNNSVISTTRERKVLSRFRMAENN
jgi:hypothetical protein